MIIFTAIFKTDSNKSRKTQQQRVSPDFLMRLMKERV